MGKRKRGEIEREGRGRIAEDVLPDRARIFGPTILPPS